MESVGRYGLVRELGRGGFGVVYEGVDSASGARVAVKVLEGLGVGSAGRAQLMSEAAALEAVVSPFTLRVLDVVDSGSVLALVTDLVPGVALRQVLDVHGRLSGPDALVVLRGAGRGLAAVHGAGLVHGDVKPANMLVEPSGSSRLIDFGLAALPGWISEDSASPWGSPAYAPPEQVLHNYRDARSDIYSLTVTLYEVLCGQRPFTGDTAELVRDQHVRQELPDPRYLVPDLGHGLTQLLMWGLAKDPGARPPDVGTWLAYLEAGAEEQYGPDWAAGGAIAAIAGGLAGGGLLASGVVASGSAAGAAGAAGAASGALAAGGAGVGSGAAGGAGAAAAAGGAGGAASGAGSGIASGFLATAAGKGVATAVAVAVVATGGVTTKVVVDHVHHDKPAAAPAKTVDKIAYISCDGTQYSNARCRIHTVNPDGSGRTTLPLAPGPATEAKFSPDGTHIAYVILKSGPTVDASVWVIGADGSGNHRVASGYKPAWSPDGTAIAFTRPPQGNEERYSLRVVNVDGGTPARPTILDATAGGTASWSPDGERIAYIGEGEGYGGCGGVITEPAYVIAADGSGSRKPLGKFGIFDAPQWVDGSRLVATTSSHHHLVKQCGDAPEPAIGVVSTSGAEQSEVNDFGDNPSLSPDGKQVAFLRWGENHSTIFLAPTSGGTAKRIAPFDAAQASVAWAPDGAHLAFGSPDEAGDGQAIHVVATDGSGDRIVGQGFSPSWAAVPIALADKAPAAATVPDIRRFDFKNALLPANTCVLSADNGWPAPGPIQLHGGEGQRFTNDQETGSGAYIASVRTVGFADFDHDGRTDVLLDVDCSGTPKALCCAGRTSMEHFAVPLRVGDDRRLELIGATIGSPDHDGQETSIETIGLNGATVRTTEAYSYPDVSGAVSESARFEASYTFNDGVWTPTELD